MTNKISLMSKSIRVIDVTSGLLHQSTARVVK